VYDNVFAATMEGNNVIEVTKNGSLLHISINEITSERASISWMFSRQSRGEDDALFTPDRPLEAAINIPEEFFSETSALRDLENPWKEVFNADKMKNHRILSWLMRSFCLDLSETRKLSENGLFLLGEAMHAEPILGGQGANEALRDSVLLAEVIGEKGVEGVKEWIEKKHEEWRRGVEESEKTLRQLHEIVVERL
jgi:2-polyprenyl-6-methoxyphenol hydroxylase-like FAD-dependent oxidoreductase